jgi:hypothetical protein
MEEALMPHEYVLLAPRMVGLREIAHAVAATRSSADYRMGRDDMQIIIAEGGTTVVTFVHPVPALPSELGRLLAVDSLPDAGAAWWTDAYVPWGAEPLAEQILAATAALLGGGVLDLAPAGRG